MVQDNDDVIELTQVVAEEPILEEHQVIELTQVIAEESSPEAKELIELTQVVAEASPLETRQADEQVSEQHQDDSGPPLEALVSDEVPAVTGDSDVDRADGVAFTRKPDEPVLPPLAPELERGDLEAVLERVIEKKFSETIEKILFEVTEKVVKREIEEIKSTLRKDLDDMGQA